MSENEILKPLADEEVQKLLEILEKCLPESIVIYNWILKHLEWREKIQSMKIEILSPDGNFEKGCVAIGISRGVSDKLYGVVFSTHEKEDALKKCLINTNLIPWDEFSHFTGVLERHAIIMSEVLKAKGYKTTDNEISQSYLLHIPREKALELKIPKVPDNCSISPVDVSHIPEAMNIWDDYKQTVDKMFEFNHSSAIFQDVRGGGKKLIAMNVQAEYGGISVLQTAPQYQRFGFGTMVLTSLTKKLAENGVHPHGHVLKDNAKSLGLFKKCGYHIVGKSYWVFVKKAP